MRHKLPVWAAVKRAPAENETMDQKKIHILLVEDDPGHCQLIQDAFQRYPGHVNLITAANISQARSCLTQNKPDLVITDLILPDGSGKDLVPHDNERLTYPVIVMTAHGNEEAAVDILKAGALDYIVKSDVTLADIPHRAERALCEWSNILRRKHAEDALRESQQRFETLFECAPDAIFIIDVNGNFVDGNRAAEKTCGYNRQQLIGKNFAQAGLLTADQMPKAFANLKKNADGYPTGPDEFLLKNRNGTHVPLEIRTFPVKIGNQIFSLGVARDITERKKTEEALKKARRELETKVEERTAELSIANKQLETEIAERKQKEKMLRESEKLAAAGRLAARIAHEINNPLAGIRNSFLLIKDAVPTDHKYYEYVALIDKEISRVARIVQQMFDLYRPVPHSPTKFQIRRLIDDVVTLLKLSTEDPNIDIKIDIQDDSASVVLVEGLLKQVLFNLIKNAVQVSPTDRIVKISAGISPEHLTIDITDHGPGIPQAIHDKIFEPFFTTSSQYAKSGLGLGLSICKSATDAMNGSISFKTQENIGTTFTVVIPLTYQKTEASKNV